MKEQGNPNHIEPGLKKISTLVIAVIPTLGSDIMRINKTIQSVKKHTRFTNLKIIVVNNSKSENLIGLDEVDEVISCGINLGWVGSIELVRRKFLFDYLWTIQDDMVLINDVLGRLLENFSESNRLAVTSPIALKNGKVPAFSRGGVWTDKSRLEWVNIPAKSVSPELLDLEKDLCFVASSGALWNASALNSVGGFNLNLYPLVHTDVEVCFRLTNQGWNLRIERNAHVAHEVGKSTNLVLRATLNRLNKEIVNQAQFNPKSHDYSHSSLLDLDFLIPIVRKSSFLFLDVSQDATQQISQLVNDNLQIKNSFFNSTSWKLTKRLQLVSNLLRKLFSTFNKQSQPD